MSIESQDEPKTALNIVLLPDRKTFHKALLSSTRVSHIVPTEFELNSKEFRPHITLYQGYYPDRNIKSLLLSLEQNIKPQKPADRRKVDVKMTNFEISHDTFLFWNCAKTESLVKLHQDIIEIANPFREGSIPPNVVEMLPTLPEQEREIVESTGSILNLELFHPHITITRLKNPTDAKKALANAEVGEPIPFEPHFINVAKLGAHGTVSSVIAEIPFR